MQVELRAGLMHGQGGAATTGWLLGTVSTTTRYKRLSRRDA